MVMETEFLKTRQIRLHISTPSLTQLCALRQMYHFSLNLCIYILFYVFIYFFFSLLLLVNRKLKWTLLIWITSVELALVTYRHSISTRWRKEGREEILSKQPRERRERRVVGRGGNRRVGSEVRRNVVHRPASSLSSPVRLADRKMAEKIYF